MTDKIPWYLDEGGDVRDAEGNYALSVAGVDVLARIIQLVNAEPEVVAELERARREVNVIWDPNGNCARAMVHIDRALALLRGDAPDKGGES